MSKYCPITRLANQLGNSTLPALETIENILIISPLLNYQPWPHVTRTFVPLPRHRSCFIIYGPEERDRLPSARKHLGMERHSPIIG